MQQTVAHVVGNELGALQIEYDGPLLEARALGVFHVALDRLVHYSDAVFHEATEGMRTAFWIETYNKLLSEMNDPSAQSSLQAVAVFDFQLMELRKHIGAILKSVDNPDLKVLVNRIAKLRSEMRRGQVSNSLSLVDLAARHRVDPPLLAKAAPLWPGQRTVKAVVSDLRIGSLYETLLFFASQPDARAILQNFAANFLWLIVFSGSRAIKALSAPKNSPSPPIAVTTYRKERVATLVERLVETLSTDVEGAELRLRHTTSRDKEELVLTLKIPKRLDHQGRLSKLR